MSQNDLDAVNAIEMQAFQDPWSKQDFINELESNPYSCIYVKEINGEVVAYVDLWIAYENAEIANIAVKKEFLHQGIASELMQYCLQKIQQSKCENFTLEVRVSNMNAIKLYEKFGFQTVSKRKKYYADGEDAYLMVQL